MLEFYFKYRRVIARFRRGVLGTAIDHIADDLSNAGYKRDSVKLYLARIARFSAYATECGCIQSKPISREIIDGYLRARPTLAARWGAQVAIGHAARCCPDRFTAATEHTTYDPDGLLLGAYSQHLRLIRGLQPKTCEGLVLTARRMLAWQKEHLAGKPLSELAAKHVLAMTHDLLAGCCSDSARSSTTAHMRSFLRYLHWANLNAQELAQFVPRTPCWRQAHLPPRLAWEDVRRAIDAIETTTPSGIRDRAIMLLLATTGLRNKELRELELGDIRWRAGELVLRQTKGHRDRVVPLLEEPGAALAEYVLHARPPTTDRRIFLSLVPPIRAFSHSSTVSRIVRTRLQRAGVAIQRGGAHLLRHSLATRLVEAATTHQGESPICWAIRASIPHRSTSRSPCRSSPMSRCRFPEVNHDCPSQARWPPVSSSYIALQHSLGYQFRKQAASLYAFLRYVRATHARGPLSQALALDFVMASDLTPNGKAIRYAVIRRFAEYHAAFDPRTESLDRRALPRSRAIPPPRILSERRAPVADGSEPADIDRAPLAGTNTGDRDRPTGEHGTAVWGSIAAGSL